MRTLRLPPATPPFTRADWARLPEGFPAQLIEGWLVKQPSPRYGHQRLVLDLCERLARHAGRARVVPAPFDVEIDDLNVYQPDVVVLRRAVPDDERCCEAPLLVVEVLSPSTAERDRGVKRRRLLAAGTGEVWLVDPSARTVEVHDGGGRRLAREGEEVASAVLAGFSLTPAALFAPPEP